MSVRRWIAVALAVVTLAAAGVWFFVGWDERRAIDTCQDQHELGNDAYDLDWADASVVKSDGDIVLVQGTLEMVNQDGARIDARYECNVQNGAVVASVLTTD